MLEVMPKFEIRHEDFVRDPGRRAAFHLFHVRSGQTEAILAAGLSDLVRPQWGLDDSAGGEEIERRVALRYLKEHLASVTVLAPHRIVLTAWDRPDLGEGWTVHQVPVELPYERKECKYWRSGEAGPLCGAAHERDRMRGRTTLALCERCGLPSTDILCDNLVYVKTVGVETDQAGLTKRSLVEAQCNVGSEEFTKPERDAKRCIPGGLKCWVQVYEPEEHAVSAETGERNLAAEALDMMDTLNIIFRDQFDADLFRLKQFRTGRVLMAPCTTEDSLALKLQILGDLIDLINSKELGRAQGVTSKTGSINWLAAFLEKVAEGDSAPVIQTLRDIKTVRNQLAAHSVADDFVDACARLGIDFPITDWERAWGQVLSAFLDALRRLQGLLP